MKILNGHDSAETAYVVDDYPYGFRLRCKIRYWLEFRSGHGHRFVSQTTNPKIQGREVWNKPKGSTYSNGPAVMYLDHQGHVQWDSVSLWSSPEAIIAFDKKWRADLLPDVVRSLDALTATSQRLNPVSWAQAAAQAI